MNDHTQEQGLRVHHLVNLGGLIAVAGLDREPPDFLLGVLISLAHERDALTSEQRAKVASLGRQKLDSGLRGNGLGSRGDVHRTFIR